MSCMFFFQDVGCTFQYCTYFIYVMIIPTPNHATIKEIQMKNYYLIFVIANEWIKILVLYTIELK